MAKICPETNSYVLYLDCLECEDKVCETGRGSQTSPFQNYQGDGAGVTEQGKRGTENGK